MKLSSICMMVEMCATTPIIIIIHTYKRMLYRTLYRIYYITATNNVENERTLVSFGAFGARRLEFTREYFHVIIIVSYY